VRRGRRPIDHVVKVTMRCARWIAPLVLITIVLGFVRAATAHTAVLPTVPVITTILEHQVSLGLSASQVEALGRLSLDFTREAIRRQVDLQLGQIDLDVLLGPSEGQTVDVKVAETKLREVEKVRADLQIALIRAVEAARTLLTSEQRAMLPALLSVSAATRDTEPVPDPPDAARGSGPAPSGGAGHAPSGPRPSPGGGGHVPPGGGAHPRPPAPRPGEHHDSHHHVVISGWPTFWWAPYWYYAPSPVEAPPAYVPPPPTSYWYYCSSAQAYYPYVTSCPESWILLPARPE